MLFLSNGRALGFLARKLANSYLRSEGKSSRFVSPLQEDGRFCSLYQDEIYKWADPLINTAEIDLAQEVFGVEMSQTLPKINPLDNQGYQTAAKAIKLVDIVVKSGCLELLTKEHVKQTPIVIPLVMMIRRLYISKNFMLTQERGVCLTRNRRESSLQISPICHQVIEICFGGLRLEFTRRFWPQNYN